MKKLSIEEKAKRYDDLLVKLQEAKVDNNVCDDRYCCVIEDIVPELAEYEDEKTREELLLDIPKVFPHDKAFRYIAYLEKQGEQKPVDWSEEDENLLKLSLENLTELKDRFGEKHGKVGDCIVFLESIKDRVQPQPHWKPSDGQVRALEAIIGCVGNNSCLGFSIKWLWELLELKEQLKKLREE